MPCCYSPARRGAFRMLRGSATIDAGSLQREYGCPVRAHRETGEAARGNSVYGDIAFRVSQQVGLFFDGRGCVFTYHDGGGVDVYGVRGDCERQLRASVNTLPV